MYCSCKHLDTRSQSILSYPPTDRRNLADATRRKFWGASVTMNSQVSDERPADQRPQPERWPVRSGTVPPLAECFSLRPETGFDIAISPAPGETVVLTPPTRPPAAGRFPLAGMGGTGKTQLATALARFLWGSAVVDLLAWVSAVTRDSLITGYAQAGAAAGSPGAGEAPEAAAAGFLDWLAGTGRPWLVVRRAMAPGGSGPGPGHHPAARRRGPRAGPQDPGDRGVQPARGAELPDRPPLPRPADRGCRPHRGPRLLAARPGAGLGRDRRHRGRLPPVPHALRRPEAADARPAG